MEGRFNGNSGTFVYGGLSFEQKNHPLRHVRMIIKTEGVETFLIYFLVNIRYLVVKVTAFPLNFRSIGRDCLITPEVGLGSLFIPARKSQNSLQLERTELCSSEELSLLSIRTLRCNAFRIMADIVLFQRLVLIKLNTRLPGICI